MYVLTVVVLLRELAEDDSGVASNSIATPLARVSDVMAQTEPALGGYWKNYS